MIFIDLLSKDDKVLCAMDLDLFDPEVEAQMDERQMEEEEEIAIHGARGGGRRQWSYL